ncbi:hypothetical protein LTR64_001069 [Lithohypha guttulata]|uniref:uncharacterized protein n=1 Tax=Lithohypha guttulata TaxID=1690604 RepID=UPI002DDE5857|nr:hypothetical protein LTR51_003263 [Lithohypha guttulata]
MERPMYIDLSATGSRAFGAAGTARSAHPSPRIQHFDGEIPPLLSPLDAIAAESRRLAKELEATRIAGERRMSRLPPAVITKSLSQHQANRPACFRSLSAQSDETVPPIPQRQDLQSSGFNPEYNEPLQRPTSSYPRLGAIAPNEDHSHNQVFKTPQEHPSTLHTQDYFDLQRTSSPEPVNEQFIRPSGMHQALSSIPQTTYSSGLVPPSAPFTKSRPYPESSDDDYTSSNAGSTFSQPRKLSNSSGMSFPVSPALPSQHERTPSNRSEISVASLTKARNQFNFSRPMSPATMNLKVDSPTRPGHSLERKSSHLSEQARSLTSFEDDRSVLSDGSIVSSDSPYTHNKFTLPRGKFSDKAVQRVSQLFSELSGPTLEWKEPVFPGMPLPQSPADKDDPLVNGSPSARLGFHPGRSSVDLVKPSYAQQTPMSARTDFAFGFEQNNFRATEQPERSSSSRSTQIPDTAVAVVEPRSKSLHDSSPTNKSFMPTLPTIPGSTVDDMSLRSSRPTTSTERSASTIRPTTARSHSDYQALSADEHVEKAISLHQNGSLKESTYHLRIAAKQNHPTGMLLYALACRHGWGMRANPQEGVALLRKAVDIGMLEVAEDENGASPLPKADFQEKKAHRAQFALAIYELGISHLNGWGVEQDKALALRCFEIAGTWGDVDAMTEAGFCYAEGVGCKKDLKRAAKFYRLAADQGVSMIGNSWIYKEKYNDNNDDKITRSRGLAINEGEKKKPRSKSKTRSFFGRKRANTLSEKAPASPKMSIEQ